MNQQPHNRETLKYNIGDPLKNAQALPQTQHIVDDVASNSATIKEIVAVLERHKALLSNLGQIKKISDTIDN